MTGQFAIRVDNDTPEFWGPYNSRDEAAEIAAAFIIQDGTWAIITADEAPRFDGRPE